ncbi:hypothetical protein [Anatilimnocola floriformis]|uniref:hypothetical protein n=1 Tax=Anatilimnocola floriformis TaxID=2948575 RepID=UPI0020C2111B|nr:hypothetical protein [Anatilimnocola floriformis]
MWRWSLLGVVCLVLLTHVGCRHAGGSAKGGEKSKITGAVALPTLHALSMPSMPSNDDLKGELVNGDLPETAKEVIKNSQEQLQKALEELKTKYDAAGNKPAAEAVANYIKPTDDRISELKKALEENLKKE